MKRRSLLKAAAVICGAAPLAACEDFYSGVTRDMMGQKIPDNLELFSDINIDPIHHLLSRAAYGPWPGELDEVKTMGIKKWIDQQLEPEKIDDRACDVRARRFETIHMEPGSCFEFKKEVLRRDIVRHTLLRAIYSKRQLLEVMVSFWTDHININLDKGDCIYLKPSDDRLVIRKHALGKFRDLIRASALSPAMLVYLDGKDNRKSGPHDVPNENYARELLELHTLGVHGGYSQKDVFEVARCLTGWRLKGEWERGVVYFDPAFHDNGEKKLLAKTIPAGGGEKDLDRILDILTRHPSCAKYISTKLVQKFVADDPPTSLVESCAAEFSRTDGDIKSVLRVLLNSTEFQESKGGKLKRPFHFVVSSLRSLGADTHAHDELIEYLQRMGQAPFQYPTPDGFPEEPGPWLGSLLWRWKFALALTRGQVPHVKVQIRRIAKSICGEGDFDNTKLISYFLGRRPTDVELQTLQEFQKKCPPSIPSLSRKDEDENEDEEERPHDAHREELLGLILCTPAFQRF